MVIKMLKERIKSLSGNIKEEKIKQELDEIKTINIELDHKVTKLIAENEHLKQTYKQLYDSIKLSRIRSKEQCDDLIKQVNIKSAENSNLNVVQIILWYLDSGSSRHMTRDRSQVTNFVNKFMGTVKFGNDHVAKIMGYGDYKIGNFTNLEVAFRQHTCFIHNLEGVNLLIGSRGNNLYTLSLGDMMASSPICLLSKASKTKSWLWHRCLSHLNFGEINHLSRQGLVRVSKQGHWFSFEKRVGKGAGGKVFRETFYGLKGWKNRFFFLDQRDILNTMAWIHHDSNVNDPVPKVGLNVLNVQVLTAHCIDLRPVPSGLLFRGGLSTTWDFPSFLPIFKDTKGNAKRYEEKSNIIKEIRATTDAAIRNQGASIKTLEIQIGQMSKVLQERGFRSLSGSTKTNPRDHVKSILTAKADSSSIRRIGCGPYVVLGSQHKSIMSEIVPFLTRLHTYCCNWREARGVKILEAYDHTLTQKGKDPGSFTVPCFIHNICFNKALVDLGASVSAMPFFTYTNLGLGILSYTRLTIELADRTIKQPSGTIRRIFGFGIRRIDPCTDLAVRKSTLWYSLKKTCVEL
nr:hypothetical protein [Tanacetum cinerariifolium]